MHQHSVCMFPLCLLVDSSLNVIIGDYKWPVGVNVSVKGVNVSALIETVTYPECVSPSAQ